MAFGNPDWSPSVPAPTESALDAGNRGALMGYTLGQKAAERRALNALDLNNPQSVNTTLGALVRAGAAETANSVVSLGLNRLKVQAGQNFVNWAGALGGGNRGGDALDGVGAPPVQGPTGVLAGLNLPPAAPPATPAAPDEQMPDLASMTPDQHGHILETLDHMDAVERQISALPYAQRKAALAQMAARLTDRGMDASRIQNFDPTDDNIRTTLAAHDQLRAQIGALGGQVAGTPAHLGGAPGSQSPSAIGPSPNASPDGLPVNATAAAGGSALHASGASLPQATAGAAPVSAAPSGATGIDLRDPRTQGAIMSGGFAGFDVAPAIQMGTAIVPSYTNVNGRMVNAKTGETAPGNPYYGEPPAPGAAPVYDNTGQQVGWRMLDGSIQATEQASEARATGEQAATAAYAGRIAGAKAAGELPSQEAMEAFKAGLEIVPGMTDENGQPVYRTRLQVARGQAPAHGQSPQAQAAAVADTKNYADAFKAATDPDAVAKAQQRLSAGEQAVRFATHLDPAAFTGREAQIANYLKGLGLNVGNGFAGDAAAYNALTRQILRGQFTTFPQTNTEFHLVEQAAASINTPADAAKLSLGVATAMARKDLAYRHFVASHPDLTTLTALNRAWLASSQGRAEPFADPIFRDMQIGGQPAVVLGQPGSKYDGWGLWRPGTPYKQVFRVR